MDEQQYHRLLVQRFADNTCSREEAEVFFRLLAQGKLDAYLTEDMERTMIEQERSFEFHRIRKIRWSKYAAAAAILILMVAGSLLWFTKNQAPPTDPPGLAADIEAPAINKASIRLSNGQVVYLDSAANGSLATQGDVSIMKLADGKIAYSGSASEIAYNVLSNPRGSKVIDITLADGSRVWLNAGSSITYPVAFTGAQRSVSVSGEAYFEVASNKKMPFKVKVDRITVEVLGTHFNINSYSDEPSIETTLLEGSVKISMDSARGQTMVLRPGQQAQVGSDAAIRLVEHADIEQAIAWKNGLFQFRKTDIQTVMRQLSCWYDVDVAYAGKIPEDKFGGNLPRDSNISVILKALEQAELRFKLEGRKIIVLP